MSETASPSYLESFKNKARVWASKVVDLYNTPVPPDLQPKKDELLNSAKTIKRWIEGVFGTLDELDNVGLGILPLIPLAVVIGGAATIANWSINYASLITTINERKRLENRGLTPDQILQFERQQNEKKNALINIDWKATIPIALVGGGLLLYWNRKR